jgi:hypothetical protein
LIAKALSWGVPALALLMLGLTLTPAGVWKAPSTDAVYRGFDPNLVYTNDGGGGSVQVSSNYIDISAPAKSNPSANLATTLLQKLKAELDVTVLLNNEAGQPLRIGIWSPWTGDGYLLVFGPAPQNLITAQTISNGAPGPSLIGGDVVGSTTLGSYRLGSSYHLAILLDRSAGRITASVLGDGINSTAYLVAGDAPRLFGNVQASLTASAIGGEGTSDTVLRNYRLTLPHQRWWASKVDDPIAKTLLVFLAFMGVLAVAAAVATMGSEVVRSVLGAIGHPFALRRRGLVLVGAAIGAYLVGNALLFPLGGHPFDMSQEKLYAYVARAYGPAQLYYLPNVVSLARILSGVPYFESAFPYEPVSAYLSTTTGWLNSLLTAGGGTFRLDDVRLEYVIKALNVLFGLADGLLIYAILRRLGTSTRWSLTAAGLFMFNPATWFSMSVWGQTHVFSLFLVLLAILLAEKRMPLGAWLALMAAVLTRPQMVVFGLLIGIVLVRKFSWRENLSALSWTGVLAFLALVPFTLATGPSLPVDILLNNFHVQEAGGNAAALTTVSQDAYSVWPLVTYLVNGASGTARAFTPSSTLLVGTLTYQRLSQILTVAALLAVAGALLARRRTNAEPGGYLPLVALGIASFLMLLTGIVATHFLLALPFLLLCRRWMGGVAYYYVAVVWTITTFVPMYGDMGVAINSHAYPLLAPANNALTKLAVELYSWDRFITVSIVANICAVVWLAVVAFRPSSSARVATPSPAV